MECFATVFRPFEGSFFLKLIHKSMKNNTLFSISCSFNSTMSRFSRNYKFSNISKLCQICGVSHVTFQFEKKLHDEFGVLIKFQILSILLSYLYTSNVENVCELPGQPLVLELVCWKLETPEDMMHGPACLAPHHCHSSCCKVSGKLGQ